MFMLHISLFVSILFFVPGITGTTRPLCQPNEEFIECGSLCHRTCGNKEGNCTRVEYEGNKCKGGCYCKKNYIRLCAEDGPCEPETNCMTVRCIQPTKVTPTIICPTTKPTHTTTPTICPTTPPTSICPTKPTPTTTPSTTIIQCGRNEIFIKCGSLCQETCATKGQNCTRVGMQFQCANRCYCKPGYIRLYEETGSCEPESECLKINSESPEGHESQDEHGSDIYKEQKSHEGYESPEGYGSHEEHESQDEHRSDNGYKSHKEQDSHEGYGSPEGHGSHEEHGSQGGHVGQVGDYSSPSLSEEDSATKNYTPYYDSCPYHEHFECGSACQTTCENLGKECPIKNIVCNNACYCDEGYARDKSNTCIRVQDCPRVKH